jgi:polyphenol oxidase
MNPLTAPTLQPFQHGWFGREGGVSTGIYATLNAGPGSNDAPKAVAENRRRIAAHFAQPPERLLSAHQVHSPLAAIVDGPWTGPRPQVDALVTAAPGVVVTVLTADCAPVLLADPKAKVIAAAHAGWKGAISGVLQETVRTMQTLGADPARIVAVVGPTIQQSSYEVGPEFLDRFLAADPANARYFQMGREDRQKFDLPAYCVTQLQQAGVNGTVTLPHDTYAGPEQWHSHRRSVHESLSDYGRNCAAIMIAEG